MFSIFVNRVASGVTYWGKHGLQLLPGLTEMFIVLYVDDVELLSSTPQRLQTQLNCVHRLCEDLDPEVNINRTKVRVFRKGGYLRRSENLVIDGKQLEVVNRFAYLYHKSEHQRKYPTASLRWQGSPFGCISYTQTSEPYEPDSIFFLKMIPKYCQ